VSGVRTFVVVLLDEEGPSSSSAAACCCGLAEEGVVGISRELRRKMVFLRTEIAGSDWKKKKVYR